MTIASHLPLCRHLLVIEDQNARRTIALEDSKYSLGRNSSNSIMLHSKQASRKHATLMRKSNSQTNQYSFWILDGDIEGNKSHNGIFVNGEKCLVHELRDGDLINFGCDVTASYHLMSSFSDTLVAKEGVSEGPEDDKTERLGVTNLHQRNTLILSDGHLETDRDDDTFQDQAYLDVLTDLPNRTLFNEYFSIALTNAKRQQTQMALLWLDLEDFSNVNDSFGYAVGDQLLQAWTERLNNCVRSGDIVARWGGDEFTVLLPQIKQAENLEKISQRILNTLQQPFEVENQPVYLKTRLGVALYPRDGEEAKCLLKKAETDLKSDRQQDNSHHSRGTTIATNTSRLSRVEYRLYQALEHNELCLYYQPQVNIKTGEIDSMEALLRWQHPQKGLISPCHFLPWAEKTALILPLSQWIFQTACAQNQAWQASRLMPLPVSVNMSSRQLQHPDLLKVLTKALSETGLSPHWLEIEVTEETILPNLDLARRVLQQLQQIGVSLAIDNFGKGYGAINYLQAFPFQKLKIDQSLVHQLIEKPQDTNMIAAMIALGKSFNLRVVAEGVETQEQLEILNRLHCEGMQGYRFSQPLAAKEATQFLSLYRSQR